MAGSSLLMASHLRRYCLIRRSLRLPKILVRSSSNIMITRIWGRHVIDDYA
ncbi:hypothetical protein EVA_15389 [gut metagenome]|uniref:Uncharacterized protein n=1 Tax=gut metagenome TaxID=749906 RepID=J9C9D0_9ZZZZ